MIRRLGCACNVNPTIPEWVAVRATPATEAETIRQLIAVGPVAGSPHGLAGFDTSAAGLSYDGQPVASWVQLALGVLALRNL